MAVDENKVFDFDKYNDFLAKIKVGSPVHKINFTMASPNAIVGMYLITMNDMESYIDKVADYGDLEENTLLVFESRHVVECCQIIYGCLNILKGVGMYRMEYEVFIEQVMDTLLTRPSFYSKTVKELDTLTNQCIKIQEDSDESNKIYDKFKYIMKNIWFVPYGRIDEMAEQAIDEFKKQSGMGDDNE